MAKPDPTTLRAEAQDYATRGKLDKAAIAYQKLAELEPGDGNWPHRAGELLVKAGSQAEGLDLLRRAVSAYAEAGFLLKAVAVCKLILRIDASADDARQTLAELNEARGIRVMTVAPEPVRPAGDAADDWSQPPDDDDLIPIDEEVPLEIEMVAEPEVGEAARKALRASALIAALEPGRLDDFIDRCTLVDLEPEQTVFRQGDAGDSLFVVTSGQVAVIAEGPPRVTLDVLGEGAFFGEIALTTAQMRTATVEAATRVELLGFDRNVVVDLLREPSVRAVILSAVRERLVGRLVATSPLFQAYGASERGDLAARFRCREVAPGTELIAQGETSEGLFAVVTGTARVARTDGGGESILAELGPGDVFGEMSLLTGEPAVATVTAHSRMLVLQLPRTTFREVIMTHPQVLAAVGDIAESRKAALAEREDQRAIAEDHVDLL